MQSKSERRYPKGQPKAAKGSLRQIEVGCVAWVDLLGYGEMLKLAAFDLTSAEALTAIDRLFDFQRVVEKHASRYMPTFVMNDAAVAYRDLSPRNKSVTYDFLRRAYDLFLEINHSDKKTKGFPGARMVIAAGFRLRRTIDFKPFLNEGKAASIKRRLSDGLISQEQAINEALKTRITHDAIPELQGNFALTKAYLADSTGTKGGLGGPNCFIDLALFESPPPRWITLNKSIAWSSRGMTGTFAQVAALDTAGAAATQHVGIRDAFDVATDLSSSPEVAHILKQTRVKTR